MADITKLTTMLEKSINTPLLVADPAYIAIKQDLTEIVTFYASKYSDDEAILLFSKKEVYWRLATAVAPSYDLEAQFTKLTKSVRFDHYFKLIQFLQLEIDANTSCNTNAVEFGEFILDSRDGSLRNYELDISPSGSMTVSNITSSSIDVDWNTFDVKGSNFGSYELYLSKVPIYDPYEEQELAKGFAIKSYSIFDLFKNKMRIKNLDSGTIYYVTLIYRARSGRSSVVISQITTL